jgi:hypothetical protein
MIETNRGGVHKVFEKPNPAQQRSSLYVVFRDKKGNPFGQLPKTFQALFPARLDTFSRTRWLTSLTSVKQAGLLNVHNLLARALLRWVCRCQNKPLPDILAAPGWEPPGTPEASSDEEATAVKNTTETDWAAWNRNQRRGAKRFAVTRPTGVVIVALRALGPLVTLLNSIEKMASSSWEEEQMHKCCEGSDFTTRLEEAASLRRVKEPPGAVSGRRCESPNLTVEICVFVVMLGERYTS